jgi:hypothetical protein
VQSKTSNSTEFDDDFGNNLFDGVELDAVRPDEVVLESTTSTRPSDIDATSGRDLEQRPADHSSNTIQSLQARQTPGRVQSMPAMRPPQTTTNVPSNQPAPRPHAVGSHLQQGQHQVQALQQSIKSEPRPTIADTAETRQRQALVQMASTVVEPLKGVDGQPLQKALLAKDAKLDEPALFVTGRAAELVQDHLPPNVPAFNPHSESPSLRRTSGFNHSRSAAVARTAVGASAAHQTNNAPQLQDQPQQQPQAQARAQAPQRGHLVNPNGDPNRRIGMPTVAQSPLANRATYRPPGPVQQKRSLDGGPRPPLADVSNVILDGGDGLEVKRQRVMG